MCELLVYIMHVQYFQAQFVDPNPDPISMASALSCPAHRWITTHALAIVSTSRRIYRLEAVAWSIRLFNESPNLSAQVNERKLYQVAHHASR
jgi:hypothetical protein